MDQAAFTEWRSRMGFSQRQAGNALGVSPATVNAIEKGTRLPGLTIELACEALEKRQGAPMAAPSPDAIEARLNAMANVMRTLNDNQLALCEEIPEGLAARLNAIEAKLADLAPDELQDDDAEYEALCRAKLAGLLATGKE